MTMVILIAVDRHLDGAPRQAFAVGFLAALDRPEIWLFWGPYGLWLFWRDPGARKLVIGLFLLIPVLWFCPSTGARATSCAVSAAPKSRAPTVPPLPSARSARSSTDHAWPTVLLRIKVAAVLAAGRSRLCSRVLVRAGRGALAEPRRHGQLTTLAMAVLGVAWFVVVAIMTQAGFSGNNRYLVLGSALIDIAGAVGLGLGGGRAGGTGPTRRGGAGFGSALAWIGSAAGARPVRGHAAQPDRAQPLQARPHARLAQLPGQLRADTGDRAARRAAKMLAAAG